jgi:hypothetical protein
MDIRQFILGKNVANPKALLIRRKVLKLACFYRSTLPRLPDSIARTKLGATFFSDFA